MKVRSVAFVLVGLLLATSYGLLASKKWDGRSRFTVVEVADPVKVTSFDPKTKTGVEMVLPGNLEIETVAGRGRLLAAGLAQAGTKKWAADSVAQALGILITGEKSQLRWVDRLLFWWGARGVQWRRQQLPVEPFTTVDRVVVLQLAPTWDQQAGGLFSSLAVAQEQHSLKIVNTTEMVGLAAAASRGIESSGIKVVEVSTAVDEPRERCLVASPRTLHKTVGGTLLLKSFDCDWQEDGEFILYLGKQYQEFVAGAN